MFVCNKIFVSGEGSFAMSSTSRTNDTYIQRKLGFQLFKKLLYEKLHIYIILDRINNLHSFAHKNEQTRLAAYLNERKERREL